MKLRLVLAVNDSAAASLVSGAVVHMRRGAVYWITGLSGSGKTTVARELLERLRERDVHPAFLDGDILREIFGNSFGYSNVERLRLAMVYSRLCRELSNQGFDVVIATIAMFSQVRDWNREHIRDYREIYLRVPIEILAERDSKGLYARARRGEVKNVAGVDIPVDEPRSPDLLIDNFGVCTPQRAVETILAVVGLPSSRPGDR
jgi:cytidine diphosphoramidate kinase